MKINSKYISIPPYISTPMENVLSIQADGDALCISLKNGANVVINNLPKDVLENVFKAHEEYLENGSTNTAQMAMPFGPFNANPSTTGLIDPMTNITGMMQHDSSQMDAPNIPQEVLDKISTVATTLGIDKDDFALPNAEKHCNCPFCQICRALHGEPAHAIDESKVEDDVVEEEELKFREWDIEELGDKLFQVTNPFDKTEKYQVHLKTPVGCTCGKSNCEHVLAVLNT